MKIFIVFIIIMSSCFLFSQDLLMQDGRVTQCSGRFLDSGGATGNYDANENFTLTICPDSPGAAIRLSFFSFSVLSSHSLIAYNGEETVVPIGVWNNGEAGVPTIITSNDPLGCLTLVFNSNGAESESGWEASISCVSSCQVIKSQLDNAIPAPNAQGYIRVCPDELITLEGSATFSQDGAGATYEWDLGDGNTIAGQTATFSYATPGIYFVNLNIRDTNTANNPLGCRNNNTINQVIHVGTAPDFSGTEAEKNTICVGEQMSIKGIVNTVEYIENCTPPVSASTTLPDGVGVSYDSSIFVSCYEPSQTITNATQLKSICMNIEHSYLEDLVLELLAPSGEIVVLKNNNIDVGSKASANLGEPWASDKVDDMSDILTPGVGYDYCFLPDSTLPSFIEGIREDGVFTAEDGPETYDDFFLPAGNYRPDEAFDALIGATLNGFWTLRITDTRAQDNGNIFSWNIEFDPSILPDEFSFEPNIVSKSWDPDPSIINTIGDDIIIAPTTLGVNCYTYRVVDDFGCDYEKEICVTVFPEVTIASVQDIETCTASSSLTNIDLTINNANVLGVQNPTLFTISYHLSVTDAEEGVNPIESPISYLGTDEELITVRLENTQTGCFDTATFELIVNAIGFNLDDNYTLCVNKDGTEVIVDPIIETGLNTVNYELQWYFNGEIFVGETGDSHIPIQGGTYSVVVTDLLTGCSTSIDDVDATAEVNESTPPVLTADQVNLSFVESNTILATALFNGNVANSIIAFEFSLDGGPWVSNTPNDGVYTFENVGAGQHTVVARDINGCGITSVIVNVLDYPLYFTPNGDGFHDTWNVIGIANQPNAKISIFNRYGKLIKEISPTGIGWDGTYNGQLMPSDDYWFKIEYIEPITNEKEEFKAHFSLKR